LFYSRRRLNSYTFIDIRAGTAPPSASALRV
jgi:hypothetical protein